MQDDFTVRIPLFAEDGCLKAWTYIDADDYERARRYHWYLHATGYAFAELPYDNEGKRARIRLHRLIISAPAYLEVDHANGDKLDNRKRNLRWATHRQNMHNVGLYSSNSSGYKGVSWDKTKRKWTARIRVDGKYLFLGRFEVLEEAAFAYEVAAQRHFGEFAHPAKAESC